MGSLFSVRRTTKLRSFVQMCRLSKIIFIKECIPVGCVPPARYRTGEGVSLTETPPWPRPPPRTNSQTGVKTLPCRNEVSSGICSVILLPKFDEHLSIMARLRDSKQNLPLIYHLSITWTLQQPGLQLPWVRLFTTERIWFFFNTAVTWTAMPI